MVEGIFLLKTLPNIDFNAIALVCLLVATPVRSQRLPSRAVCQQQLLRMALLEVLDSVPWLQFHEQLCMSIYPCENPEQELTKL